MQHSYDHVLLCVSAIPLRPLEPMPVRTSRRRGCMMGDRATRGRWVGPPLLLLWPESRLLGKFTYSRHTHAHRGADRKIKTHIHNQEDRRTL